MRLGEKLRYLRDVEGTLRGLGRPLTQTEVVAAIREEIGATISQSYLSQIESGARPHLTNGSRMLLARFFRVHPGYLVDDPEGFHTELLSDLRAEESRLDLWLVDGAERFRNDPELAGALLRIAKATDSRGSLLLLGDILDTPNLAERLAPVLRPTAGSNGRPLAADDDLRPSRGASLAAHTGEARKTPSAPSPRRAVSRKRPRSERA